VIPIESKADPTEEKERACWDRASGVVPPKDGALLCENCAKSVWN
jgi:hypothetical protein